MKRLVGVALTLLVLALSCAAVRRGEGLDGQGVRAVAGYTLSVRADDRELEPFLAQRAREAFSALLPLDGGPGRLVLRFSVRAPRPGVSPTRGAASSGAPPPGPLSPPPSVLPGSPEPPRRTWVDADLLVRVEDGSGRALYSAAASVRGRRHLVENPRRAAELCLQRVARDLEAFLGERRGSRSPGP
ncbi:MAG: hypothetical protein ACP5VN_09490 [Acidobacteriota bacterium]